MIKTNVGSKFNYFGTSGISYVNAAMDNGGTLSSILNADGSRTIGRFGFAYTSTTTQTGYLWTNPINGTTFNSSTDFVWIKDLQVELKDHATQFTKLPRTTTQSLIDLKKTTTIDVSNVSFDSTAHPVFDGTSDYISCPHNALLDNGTQISIECWVKTSFDATFPGEIGIIRKGTGTSGWTNPGWSIRLRDDIPAVAFRKQDDSGYWDLYQGAKIIDGKWHHIVGTFDTSNLYKYVDGVFSQGGTTGQPYLTTTDNLEIGRIVAYFTGNISIVRIYNRVLTPTEITQNFNAYKNRFNI